MLSSGSGGPSGSRPVKGARGQVADLRLRQGEGRRFAQSGQGHAALALGFVVAAGHAVGLRQQGVEVRGNGHGMVLKPDHGLQQGDGGDGVVLADGDGGAGGREVASLQPGRGFCVPDSEGFGAGRCGGVALSDVADQGGGSLGRR